MPSQDWMLDVVRALISLISGTYALNTPEELCRTMTDGVYIIHMCVQRAVS